MRPLIYPCLRCCGSGHTESRRSFRLRSGRGSGAPGGTLTPTNGLGKPCSVRLSYWGAFACHSLFVRGSFYRLRVLAATARLWPGGIGFASALGTASQPEQLRGSSYRPYRPPMWIACGTEENERTSALMGASFPRGAAVLNAVGTARTRVPRLSQYPHRLHLTFAVPSAFATSAAEPRLTKQPQ